MVVRAFNSVAQEAEAAIFLCVWVQPGLQIKLQDSLQSYGKSLFFFFILSAILRKKFFIEQNQMVT